MPDTPRPAGHGELISAASDRGTVRGADAVHDAASREVDQNVIVLSSSPDRRRLSRGRATALLVAAAAALALATTTTVHLTSDTGGETLDVGGPPSTEPEPSPPPEPAGRPDATIAWSGPTTTTATTAPPATEAPPPTEAPAPPPPPPPITEPLPPPVDQPPVSPTTTEPPPLGPMQVPSPLDRGEIFVVTLPHLGEPDELYGASYTLRSLDGGPGYGLIADVYDPMNVWCEMPCEDWAVPAVGVPPGSEATLGIPREVEPGRYELCNSGQCARVDIR